MDYKFEDGRLLVIRDDAERSRICKRLNRIEGQVAGLRRMVEEGRYCLDEVQQAKAITAAIREVALLIMQDHVAAGIHFATQEQHAEAAIQDMVRVLRAAMRQ